LRNFLGSQHSKFSRNYQLPCSYLRMDFLITGGFVSFDHPGISKTSKNISIVFMEESAKNSRCVVSYPT
jgi:hypothetical protein